MFQQCVQPLLEQIPLPFDIVELVEHGLNLPAQVVVDHFQVLLLRHPLGPAALGVAPVLQGPPLLLDPGHLVPRQPVELLVEVADAQGQQDLIRNLDGRRPPRLFVGGTAAVTATLTAAALL